MWTNKIDDVRAATVRTLAGAKPVVGASIVEVLPCGRYSLKIEEFGTDDGREVVVATVRRTEDAQELATVHFPPYLKAAIGQSKWVSHAAAQLTSFARRTCSRQEDALARELQMVEHWAFQGDCNDPPGHAARGRF